MQSNTTCPLIEQYLSYLVLIKGRAENTIKEYRTDLLMFFSFVLKSRNIPFDGKDFSVIDIDLISSISLHEMYSFISYCQKDLGSSAETRARKIVSIRQFWKYLKTMANLIDNNIAEVLETPKLPYRIPKHLNLDESVRIKGYINVKNMPILGEGVFVPYSMYFCTFGH